MDDTDIVSDNVCDMHAGCNWRRQKSDVPGMHQRDCSGALQCGACLVPVLILLSAIHAAQQTASAVDRHSQSHMTTSARDSLSITHVFEYNCDTPPSCGVLPAAASHCAKSCGCCHFASFGAGKRSGVNLACCLCYCMWHADIALVPKVLHSIEVAVNRFTAHQAIWL